MGFCCDAGFDIFFSSEYSAYIRHRNKHLSSDGPPGLTQMHLLFSRFFFAVLSPFSSCSFPLCQINYTFRRIICRVICISLYVQACAGTRTLFRPHTGCSLFHLPSQASFQNNSTHTLAMELKCLPAPCADARWVRLYIPRVPGGNWFDKEKQHHMCEWVSEPPHSPAGVHWHIRSVFAPRCTYPRSCDIFIDTALVFPPPLTISQKSKFSNELC